MKKPKKPFRPKTETPDKASSVRSRSPKSTKRSRHPEQRTELRERRGSANKTATSNQDGGLGVVVGRNSVLDLLKVSPKRIQTLWLDNSNKPERRLAQINDLAGSEGVRIKRVPSERLDQRLASWQDYLEAPDHLAHQGVLAEVLPKTQPTIYELVESLETAVAKGETPLIIALDKVTDPRNFGAILRVADGVGAMAVLTTERHAAGFSPAVAKTASGAEATVDVVTVPNLVQALELLKKAGAWVIGAAGGANVSYTKHGFTTATVLVMGNEENGLGRLVTKTCDGLVTIPMAGQVESLNVATATAVLAFHIQQQLTDPLV